MKQTTRNFLDKSAKSIKAAEVLTRDEETFVFASSRAYYALFYAVEALLNEEGLIFKKHSGVHSAFGERFIKTKKLDSKYYQWLLEAFSNRLISDYAPAGESLSKEGVGEMIRQAREFLDAASQYLHKIK